MAMSKSVAALLLPLVSIATAQSQVIITVAVPYCPSYSSSLASYSPILPGYSSSGAFSYGSMSSPTTGANSITSSISAPESPTIWRPSSSTSAAAAPSASSYIDQYGRPYDLYANTGLSGNTIDSRSAAVRRRQANGSYSDSTLESCLKDCSVTPVCQAISYLGSTCLLYSSVHGTMFLLGGTAGFNTARFAGFNNDTGTSPASSTSGSAPKSSPILTSSTSTSNPYISFCPTTTASSGLASAGSDVAPSEQSRIDISSGLFSFDVTATGIVSTATVTPIPDTAVQSSQLPSEYPGTTSYSSSTLVSPSSLQSTTSRDLPSSTPILSNSGDLPSASTESSPLAEGSSATTSEGVSQASATTQYGGSSSTQISTTASTTALSSEYILSSAGSASSTSDGISSESTSPSSLPEVYSPTTTKSSSLMSAPTQGPMYACPANDASTIIDVNGIQYELRCSSDTGAIGLGQGPAPSSFNDCFNLCDAANSCTGFTYLGATNGAGPGDCYLKQGEIVFTEGNSARVAAVRLTTRPSASATEMSSTSTATMLEMSVTPSTAGPTMLSSYLSSIYASSGSIIITSSTSVAYSRPSSSLVATSFSPSPSSSAPFSTSRSSSLLSSSRSSSATSSTSVRPSSTSPSGYASSSSTIGPAPSPSPAVNNGKRGLAYTNASYTLPYSLSGQNSRVSWGYNWYYSRYTDNINTSNPAIRFIPLLFNDAEDVMQVWPQKAQAAIDDGADALMSFNEPDLCYPGSACMTVDQSVTAYRRAMQPFAGKIRLGAPAVTDGGAPTGLTWLSNFMGNCSDCTVDFINIHWYNNVYAFSYLQYYVQQAYKMFGLPIWITEFGIDGSGGTDAQYQAFLQQALPWLDAVPYVERYAWFLDAPGYLINANGSGLSAQGMIYNSYTASCPNWNNTQGHC